jgi:hypothetical protein
VREGQGDRGDAIAAVEADLNRLVQRLRGLSPAAWRSRRDVVADLLTRLEQATAELESRPPKPVPALPDYASANAVAVLGGDAIAAATERRDGSSVSRLGAWINGTLDQPQ